MIPLTIFPYGDGAHSDLQDPEKAKRVVHLQGAGLSISGLAGGMASGKPSVMIRFDLPDGGPIVLCETSLALFLTAADGLKAAHGDPRT